MTDWNPDDPADLGVWKELGWTPPSPASNPPRLASRAGVTAHVTSLLNPYAAVMSGWVG